MTAAALCVGCAETAYPAKAPPIVHASACARASDPPAEPRFVQESASIGRPNAGALARAVQMPTGPLWHLEAPAHAYATDETIAALVAAIEHVASRHPGGHPMHIGDLSRESGGRLYPHRSHQSGRDADVGYYYLEGTRGEWYQYATAHTLDRERTWTFLKALIVGSDVEYVFIDRRVQALLREHALSSGEDAAWVEALFEGPFLARPQAAFPRPTRNREALIRHAAGHATHIHVRFHSPEAQARGRVMYQELAARNRIAGLLPARLVDIPPRPIPPCREGTSLANLLSAHSP